MKPTMLDYITCPITKLIFCDPVVAEDGYFYEFMAIKTHLTKSNISPTTGNQMGSNLTRSPLIKKNSWRIHRGTPRIFE